MMTKPAGALIVRLHYNDGPSHEVKVSLDRHLTDLAAMFCAASAEIVGMTV